MSRELTYCRERCLLDIDRRALVSIVSVTLEKQRLFEAFLPKLPNLKVLNSNDESY